MNDMSKVEPVAVPSLPADAAPALRFEAPPSTSLWAHARHIVSENPVTGLAFGLFALILFAAVFGPSLVPYDPLASNTNSALQGRARGTGSAQTSSAATFSAG